MSIGRNGITALVLAAAAGAARAESYSCVSFDYPPLVSQQAGQPPAGFAVELTGRLFERLGHSMTVQLYPWARALEMVKSGAADCVFTIFRTPERAEFLDFGMESMIEQEIFFYTRADSTISFNGNLDSMRHLRIGTAHKINYGPRFEAMRTFLTLDEAPTIEHNFKKLLAGHIDVAVSNATTAASVVLSPSLRAQADKLRRLPVPVDSVPTYIAFSKLRKLDGLRQQLDAELRRFRHSPDYARLVQKYETQSHF